MCTCKLKFGIHAITQSSKVSVFEEKIDFLGPSNLHEKVSIKEKVNNILEDSFKYFSDNDKNVIALPNHFPLILKPGILEVNTHFSEKEINEYLDKYLEDILHQKVVGVLRSKGIKGLVIKGFDSLDCLRFKKELADKTRTNKQSECKQTVGLNEHEIFLIELLKDDNQGIKEIVNCCVNAHKQFKETHKVKTKKSESWLFDQVSLNIYLIFILIYIILMNLFDIKHKF